MWRLDFYGVFFVVWYNERCVWSQHYSQRKRFVWKVAPLNRNINKEEERKANDEIYFEAVQIQYSTLHAHLMGTCAQEQSRKKTRRTFSIFSINRIRYLQFVVRRHYFQFPNTDLFLLLVRIFSALHTARPEKKQSTNRLIKQRNVHCVCACVWAECSHPALWNFKL